MSAKPRTRRTWFGSAGKLSYWAGLTPRHLSDTHVHRGPITKQGARQVRWAAVESVKALPAQDHRVGRVREAGHRPPRPQHRRGRRRPGCNWNTSTTYCANGPDNCCTTHCPGRSCRHPRTIVGA